MTTIKSKLLKNSLIAVDASRNETTRSLIVAFKIWDRYIVSLVNF